MISECCSSVFFVDSEQVLSQHRPCSNSTTTTSENEHVCLRLGIKTVEQKVIFFQIKKSLTNVMM